MRTCSDPDLRQLFRTTLALNPFFEADQSRVAQSVDTALNDRHDDEDDDLVIDDDEEDDDDEESDELIRQLQNLTAKNEEEEEKEEEENEEDGVYVLYNLVLRFKLNFLLNIESK